MKVLVVDDDVVSRMVLMHLIDTCGEFEILEAEDGEQAWEQLEQGLRPAICFCDLRMPRLSGMDLLRRIKARAALESMPFVLVSSATDQETVTRASGFGATGYIVKPFQAEQVRLHLARFARPAAAGAHAAEAPLATQQRLGITAERLLVYLGGFQAQLASASGDIDVLLARGELNEARLRVDRLHAGCVTLGLTGAAEALTMLPAGGYTSALLHEALADTVHAVMQQIAHVKRLNAT